MVHIRSHVLFVRVGLIYTQGGEDCEKRPLHQEVVLVCVCVCVCVFVVRPVLGALVVVQHHWLSGRAFGL